MLLQVESQTETLIRILFSQLQMSGLLDALNKGLRLLKHGDDDFFDRISSRYSVALLIVFAVIVSTGKVYIDHITYWGDNPKVCGNYWIGAAIL